MMLLPRRGLGPRAGGLARLAGRLSMGCGEPLGGCPKATSPALHRGTSRATRLILCGIPTRSRG
jgi:hypothetical protein